ncbi:MAG: 2-oxo acid dehydrogenase subunit E2 [Cyanobacteria bacterium SZAS LIN-5]|nr:2-oxo acid dehydrogenase subunit E2 [Cyanobacteria bacterium SZAS LIN-5]
MSWAEDLKKKFAQKGEAITVTAMLLKAIAIAQKQCPSSRTIILPFGKVATLTDIVAGFTVERFIENGPVVFFGSIEAPDTKLLTDIMDELKDYKEADIDKHPQLNQQHQFTKVPWLIRQVVLCLGMVFPQIRLKISAATFGLSSLGKYGVCAVTGPCVSTSTFGVGMVEQRPVARNGKLEIHPMMTLSLSFDHRLIDGAAAARFLQDVRSLMEGGLELYQPAYLLSELFDSQTTSTVASDVLQSNS